LLYWEQLRAESVVTEASCLQPMQPPNQSPHNLYSGYARCR